MTATPPIVLSFAATDPSSGAGMQADILTLSAMGCYPLSVVTAITAQDTVGVFDVWPAPATQVLTQARRILEDIPVSAFKVGLLGSVEVVRAVHDVIADYPDVPVVVDPVLASGRGDPLASARAIEAIVELLLPCTTVLTPNSLEARRLCGDDATEMQTLSDCANALLARGCEYVLITGTHEMTDQVVNTLYARSGVVRADAWDRLPGSYHGSGCTLASAIAAAIANGAPVPEAVRDAQEFTWRSLRAGIRPGDGQFIPDRLFWAREVRVGAEDAD